MQSTASMWRAVARRDAGADGRFVYAVRTTGVFCRPSCGSRRPLRRNVEYFARGADAERAGYRPCLKCRPGANDEGPRPARLVVRACRLLEGDEPVRSDAVAATLGLSPFYFQRLFKKHTGVSPQAYRRRVLAERGRRALAGAVSVTQAVYEAGYSTQSRFYDGVGRELGMQPREARHGGAGRVVRYALRRCSLGTLLVAWTERGVSAVVLADTDAQAVDELDARLPRATLAPHAQVLPWVGDVVDAVERPRALDIPLDIQGTAFQQRVWRELRRIPPGQTRSYAELARALGRPSAARAVGRACATNPVAVVVPCHRAVASDGSLTGYRWGLERKQRLLERERPQRRP